MDGWKATSYTWIFTLLTIRDLPADSAMSCLIAMLFQADHSHIVRHELASAFRKPLNPHFWYAGAIINIRHNNHARAS